MAPSGTLLIKVLGDVSQFQKAMKSAENVGTVLGAALGGVGIKALHMGDEYHSAMETIRTGTGATGKALGGLEQSFKNVGGQTEHSLDIISKVMADLNTRTGLTGTELEGLTQRVLDFSDVTKSDATANTAGLTRVFGDWSIATEDQAETMDQLLRAQQASGIEMDRLMQTVVQFGAPLRLLGFEFEESIAMLAKWEKEGVNVETALTGMKFGLKTLTREGVPAADFAEEMARRIEGIKTAADPVGESIKLFGLRAGPDLAAAISEGRFATEDILEVIENGSDTVDQAAKDTEKFGDAFGKLKNQIKLAVGPIMQDFAGLTEELGNAVYLIPALGGAIGRGLGKLWTRLGGSRVIKAAAGAAGAAAHAAYAGAIKVAGVIGDALRAAWGRVIGSSVVKRAIGVAGAAAGAAYSGALKVAGAIGDALSSAWTAVKGAASRAIGIAGAAAGVVYSGAMKVADALGSALTTAWNAVKGVASKAIGIAGAAAGGIYSAAAGGVGVLAEGIRAGWGKLIASGSVRAAIAAAGATAGAIYGGAAAAVEYLMDIIKEAWSKLAERGPVRLAIATAGAVGGAIYATAATAAEALTGGIASAWVKVAGTGSLATKAAGAAGAAGGLAFQAAFMVGVLALPALVAEALKDVLPKNIFSGGLDDAVAQKDFQAALDRIAAAAAAKGIDPKPFQDAFRTAFNQGLIKGSTLDAQTQQAIKGVGAGVPAIIGDEIDAAGPGLAERTAAFAERAFGDGIATFDTSIPVNQFLGRLAADMAKSRAQITQAAFATGAAMVDNVAQGMVSASQELGSALSTLRDILKNGLTPEGVAAQALGAKFIQQFTTGLTSEKIGAKEAAQQVGIEALQALADADLVGKHPKRTGRIIDELYASGMSENAILGALAAEGVGREALQALGAVRGWSQAAIDDAIAWAAGMESKEPMARGAGEDLAEEGKEGAQGVSLYGTGAEFGASLARGIASKVRAVRNAMRTLTGVVTRSGLLESPAKEGEWSKKGGPLAWFFNAGSDSGGMLASGLLSQVGAVTSAMGMLTGAVGSLELPSLAGKLPSLGGMALSPAMSVGVGPTGPTIVENHYHFHGDFFRDPQDYAKLGGKIKQGERHTKRGGRGF